MTACSAKAIVLSFRGLDNVKTFGSPIAKYCSCNNTKELDDGTRAEEAFCEDPIAQDVECDQMEKETSIWFQA